MYALIGTSISAFVIG